MMTAAQAREKTMEKIKQIAQEFIINDVGQAVYEATIQGEFHTNVPFDGVPNPEKTGAEVVKLLEEQGYEAEHAYYDGPNGYANYICIKWEDA
jgi:hypothetical protein